MHGVYAEDWSGWEKNMLLRAVWEDIKFLSVNFHMSLLVIIPTSYLQKVTDPEYHVHTTT